MFVRQVVNRQEGQERAIAFHDSLEARIALGVLEINRDTTPGYGTELEFDELANELEAEISELPRDSHNLWRPYTTRLPYFMSLAGSVLLDQNLPDGKRDYVRKLYDKHAEGDQYGDAYRSATASALQLGGEYHAAARIAADGASAVLRRNSALWAKMEKELKPGIVYAHLEHPKRTWAGDVVVEGDEPTATVVVSTRHLRDYSARGVSWRSTSRK